ncbi:hypothetical protein Bpla01_65370 [Burkholderia plantarii]|nr:hypothetical protein Bpla01_65370 [Burkholderia plantarii]
MRLAVVAGVAPGVDPNQVKQAALACRYACGTVCGAADHARSIRPARLHRHASSVPRRPCEARRRAARLAVLPARAPLRLAARHDVSGFVMILSMKRRIRILRCIGIDACIEFGLLWN